ncbi:hypothetical protein HJC23_001328 [Cyclotella cryptica]|uniref:Major facilitator superfamily (MFS) profile domain-containing protein n=1 Tax=Cyclotella cryptica TaxID=29204 RepID=A0ABD3NXF9_9STRA|eukprot:CCRYP_019182-RA/>CCRYP_019182-RA protein AED:0.00 eAED:0.00 QI:219/-1/1/1/-1/1/1/158/545
MAINWRCGLVSINVFVSTLLTTAIAFQSTPRIIRRPVSHRTRNYTPFGRDTQLQAERNWRQQVTSTNVSANYTSPEEKPLKSSSLEDIILLVVPLLLVYISNQWSRFSISYLVDFPTSSESANIAMGNPYISMNVDIGFTETQYGLLASTAFTVLFALSSLIAGTLADKYDRKLLTLTSCTAWALATLAQSFAHSYEEVLAARLVMGGACAFASPAAYSLIADRISKEKASFANAIYASGVYVGGAFASLSLLLADVLGWRSTLAVVGLYGLFSVGVSAITLPFDEERNEMHAQKDEVPSMEEGSKPSLIRNSIEILTIPRMQYLLLASFFRFSAGLVIAIWAAPYYKQAFPESIAEYAVVNAFIKGALGMISGILGGHFAGKMSSWISNRKLDSTNDALSIVDHYFDNETILLLVPIISSLLAIPMWHLATHPGQSANSFELAMFWLALEYLVAECWFGPTIAVLQSSVKSSVRGTAQGIFVLAGAMGNISPALLGFLYGSPSWEMPLADLLSFSVSGGYFISSVFFIASVGKKKTKISPVEEQ